MIVDDEALVCGMFDSSVIFEARGDAAMLVGREFSAHVTRATYDTDAWTWWDLEGRPLLRLKMAGDATESWRVHYPRHMEAMGKPSACAVVGCDGAHR